MALTLQPDVLRVALDYLANRAEVQATFGNPARIADTLPAGAELPAALVTEIADTHGYPRWLVATSLQIDVWAATTTDARNGAELVRAALHDDDPATGFAGRTFTTPEAVTVSAVSNGLGLRPFFDPDTATPRYQCGVTLYTHPAT